MQSLLLLASSFFVPVAPSDELRPGEVVNGELGHSLDDFLTRLEGLGLAGVVGVEFEDEPILIRGYGTADRETDRRVTPDTVFTVGSITKQFTAAAILALAEEGKLSVHDPLAKFFPSVPEPKRAITLEQLLTHTSGLRDPPFDDFDLRATAEWMRDWALGCELEWKPGEYYGYRNVNYSLLGLVVDRVSGEPYEAFLRKRLFERAGMHDTGYALPHFAPERLAVGYRDGDRWGTFLERPWLADGPSWILRANGGIQSTVGDMLRWHHALRENRVLSKETRAEFEKARVPEGGGTSYGYGWSIADTPNGKLVAHNGGNRVFFADFLRYVDEGLVIFVATNVASRVRESLAYDLAEIAHGKAPRAVPATIARDREWLARYAGRYPLDDDALLEVVNLGDRLALTGHGAASAEFVLDDATRERIERMRPLAEALCAGADRATLEARAGLPMPDELAHALAEGRARWAKELGAFRSLGDTLARTGKETRLLFEARFERGHAWVAASFGPDGRISDLACLDSAPFEGLPRVELFPLSPSEFRAYDDRTGLGLSVRFELDPTGRAAALALGEPPVTIARE